MTSPPMLRLVPSDRSLDDLELMARGVLPARFDPPGGDVVLGLDEPADLTAVEGVELIDPEGVSVAYLEIDGRAESTAWGPITVLTKPEYGVFDRYRLSPATVSDRYAGRVTVPVCAALTSDDLEDLRSIGRPLLLLALAGRGTPCGLTAPALIRATLASAELLDDAAVVVVPLAARPIADDNPAFRNRVVTAYAPGDIVEVEGAGPPAPHLADIASFDRPPPDRIGLVVFFTGLSGSGKSSLARALHDLLLERGRRTVTRLDGDIVRRNLSAGLTFSKEDRETNIRRIGWVAAEVSRHGGIAICSPIAPFDSTRQEVRELVAAAGGAFFLVHVATPLVECERRDRKGLYARARAGEIPEFTGISSPYEEPVDADVRIDTTDKPIPEALAELVSGLRSEGYGL